jgi:SAM-dependent methyltransferase
MKYAMPIKRMTVPIYLPSWLYDPLRSIKHAWKAETDQGAVDLLGDRDLEWSFIASRMPGGPGEALDFGCGSGNLSIHAIQRGYRVLALDLEPPVFPWSHPDVEIVQGDLLKLQLQANRFDLILNCSTVEHVGLSGRYGVVAQETNGDLKAMGKLRTLLKPTGKMLMTIPCGQDAVIFPWHRVYGQERLPKLLSGYEVEEQNYWLKHGDKRWYPCNAEAALSYTPTSHPTTATRCSYALGCFVLRAGQA